MTSHDTGIIERQTAAQMVEAYKTALEEAAQGLALLAQAEDRLHKAFGTTSFQMIDRNVCYWQYQKPDEYFKSIQKTIKRGVWKAILDHLQINKVASQKRKDELYQHLEKDELPEVTLAAIFDIVESFRQNAGEMAKESYIAAYKALRPWQNTYNKGYKTNLKSNDLGIGSKVVLAGRVEHSAYGNFRINHYRRDDLIEVDRVFHLLDGAPFQANGSYNSPLVDGIETGENGTGQTEYFSWKCFGNGNLHLTFRRPDLVRQLNQICADGTSLRSGKYSKQTSFKRVVENA